MRTFSVGNEHVVALIHRAKELLLEVWIGPFELSNVTPWLPLGCIKQGPPQLGRESDLAPPHQLLDLLIPRLDGLALYGFLRDLF
jgi:hypothetical protein